MLWSDNDFSLSNDSQVENESSLALLRQSCQLAKYLASAVVARLQQVISLNSTLS